VEAPVGSHGHVHLLGHETLIPHGLILNPCS
jgi:hypothetical protein